MCGLPPRQPGVNRRFQEKLNSIKNVYVKRLCSVFSHAWMNFLVFVSIFSYLCESLIGIHLCHLIVCGGADDIPVWQHGLFAWVEVSLGTKACIILLNGGKMANKRSCPWYSHVNLTFSKIDHALHSKKTSVPVFVFFFSVSIKPCWREEVSCTGLHSFATLKFFLGFLGFGL
jgi:hypothetical protein